MAKRYCDTNTWEEDWFILMPPMYKLLWRWITDKCDHAGVWKPNLEAFKKFNGEIDLEKALEFFNEDDKVRITKLENGKYFLPGFFVFQYGKKMNLNNKVHLSIYQVYKDNDIKEEDIRGLKEVILTSSRPQDEVKVGVKDKDKDKDIINIKGDPEIFESEEGLMKDFKIEQCKLDAKSKGYKLMETSIEIYDGFRRAFPKNRDLPLMQKKDWIPPIRMLLDKKEYLPEQIVEVAKWAVKDEFWRENILDTKSLEKHFEKLKIKYQNGKSKAA